jgi:bacillithiol biosynthesis deacetylase BshB1
MIRNIDILAFGAHPDDVELSCSGTLLKQKALGNTIGIIDLTKGELGSRGTPEKRAKEARKSSEILGLDVRENLGLPDGFFEENEETLKLIIRVIRKYKPSIILANAPSDRHPDHGRASQLMRRACFLSGLVKIKTEINGNEQVPHRPENIYFYIQDRNIGPDFVVDITGYFDKKMECILAFDSQFYSENSEEPRTPISGKEFLKFIESRSREFGRYIHTEFGEGFITEKGCLGVNDLKHLI